MQETNFVVARKLDDGTILYAAAHVDWVRSSFPPPPALVPSLLTFPTSQEAREWADQFCWEPGCRPVRIPS